MEANDSGDNGIEAALTNSKSNDLLSDSASTESTSLIEVIKFYGLDPDAKSNKTDSEDIEQWHVMIPLGAGVVDLKILLNKTYHLKFSDQILIFKGKLMDELNLLRDYLPLSSEEENNISSVIVTNSFKLEESENAMRLYSACRQRMKELQSIHNHPTSKIIHKRSTSNSRGATRSKLAKIFCKIFHGISFLIRIRLVLKRRPPFVASNVSVKVSVDDHVIDIIKKPSGMRTLSELRKLMNWITTLSWYKSGKFTARDVLPDLARCLTYEKMSFGTFVVRQGDVGNKMYISLSGDSCVTIPTVGKVGSIMTNCQFGEISLLAPREADRIRTASIMVDSKFGAEYAVIDSDSYFKCVYAPQFEFLSLKTSCILSFPLFDRISKTDVSRLAYEIEFKRYEAMTDIICHEKNPPGLYLISSGQVKVRIKFKKHSEEIVYLVTGPAVFGEQTCLKQCLMDDDDKELFSNYEISLTTHSKATVLILAENQIRNMLSSIKGLTSALQVMHDKKVSSYLCRINASVDDSIDDYISKEEYQMFKNAGYIHDDDDENLYASSDNSSSEGDDDFNERKAYLLQEEMRNKMVNSLKKTRLPDIESSSKRQFTTSYDYYLTRLSNNPKEICHTNSGIPSIGIGGRFQSAASIKRINDGKKLLCPQPPTNGSGNGGLSPSSIRRGEKNTK